MIDVGGAGLASVGRSPSLEWHSFADYDFDRQEIDAREQVEHASNRQGRQGAGAHEGAMI